MIDILSNAIGDRSIGEQRGPATSYPCQHGVDTMHVEVGVLLAGERRVRQVLVGGARPDREGDRGAELRESPRYLAAKLLGNLGALDEGAKIGRGLCEVISVSWVELSEAGQQSAYSRLAGYHSRVRDGGDAKALRDYHAGNGGELAEVRRLPTNQTQVA